MARSVVPPARVKEESVEDKGCRSGSGAPAARAQSKKRTVKAEPSDGKVRASGSGAVPVAKAETRKPGRVKKSGIRVPQRNGGPKRPAWHSGKSGWRPSIAEWRESTRMASELAREKEALEGKVAALSEANEELERVNKELQGKVAALTESKGTANGKRTQEADTYPAEARKEIADLKSKVEKLTDANQSLQIDLDWAVQLKRQKLPPPTPLIRRGVSKG